MMLKHLFLCLFATLLSTHSASSSVCINGIKYEKNIKYNCGDNGKYWYQRAVGCVTGKNQDGSLIRIGNYFTDTDYKFLCSKVSKKLAAYLPKYCVFREVTPRDPTILKGGETKMLSSVLQAVCKINGNRGVRKELKQLEYPLRGDPNVIQYQGQYFTMFPNRRQSWTSAGAVCKAHGGILATALSPHLLRVLNPILKPSFKPKYYQVVIGLRQLPSQRGKHVGWQWVNTATKKTVNIDKGKTFRPFNARSLYLDSNAPNEGNRENYGTLMTYMGEKSVYNDHPHYGVFLTQTLCQINYPSYVFRPVRSGNRISFPQESAVTAESLEKCSASCHHDDFCRAFSYSSAKSDCQHHSAPPADPEVVIVRDGSYTVYA